MESLQKMYNSSRLWMSVMGGLLAMAMLLAACSGGDVASNEQAGIAGAGANNEQTAADTSQASDAAEQTRTVTDDLDREVEVPLAAERIVAGEFAAELLAMGVKPIAAGDNGFKVVYTQAEMAGVERIGDPPNAEKILELAPDLMIAPTVFKEIYPEQMNQIEKFVPVYYLSFDQDPIYDIFVRLSELLGKQEAANAWIDAYEQEAEQARIQVQEAIGSQTASIFRIEKGRLRIYLNRNFAGYMLRSSLQVAAPDKVAAEIEANPNSSAVQISLEMLPEYAGDHLFVIVRSEGDDQAEYDEIQQSSFWNSLPAVQAGHIYLLETEKYYGSDIVTIRETMKETAAMLQAAAAAGN